MIRSSGGRFVVAAIPVLILALAAPASAAELHAAELDGQVNDITVERGRTTTFVFHITATGNLRCAATEENPAVATFTTDYTWSPSGTISAVSSTARTTFWADDACKVTWEGAPAAQLVTLSMTADEASPLGSFTFAPAVRIVTPFGSGDRLEDRSPTFVRFHVVEPAGDRDPPEVACEGPAGAAGSNGWYISKVSYACAASDTGSGLADPADASFALSTSGEGLGRWTASREVWDNADNATTAGPFGAVDVDLSDPAVSLTPDDGTTFLFGSAAEVTHGCADEVSGIASCVLSGSVDTSVVGEHSVRVEATDHAGRTTVLEHGYHVVYDVSGPWVPQPDKVHQAGRAVPLSWGLNGVSDPASYAGVRATPVACSTGASTGASHSVPTIGAWSYAKGTDRHSVVLKTDPAWSGCVLVELHLTDGTTHRLVLTFRS